MGMDRRAKRYEFMFNTSGYFFRAGMGFWAAIAAGLAMGNGPAELWAWQPPERAEAKHFGPIGIVWADWSRSVYTREHVPYFALHPPVYYTVPVGRSYGWSPFAYPGWVQTPPVEPPRSMVIRNPYVVGFGADGGVGRAGPDVAPSPSKTKEPAPTGAMPVGAKGFLPQPIRIVNPYVEPGSQEAARSASPNNAEDSGAIISSTAQVQPRRIRNPHVTEPK
jgi:hypothetical protein